MPQIKDNFDNIYEISMKKVIDIDNDEFIKKFKKAKNDYLFNFLIYIICSSNNLV